MKKLFTVLSLVLLGTGAVYGQQNIGQRNQGTQATDPSIVSGHFEVERPNTQKGIVEHVNVNYAISPAPFSNILNLSLSTPAATMFVADVVDQNGSKLVHWKPSSSSNRYNAAIDISKLSTGNYKLNIYSENGTSLLHSISFQKEAGR